MSFPKVLRLVGWAPVIEGAGEKLQLTFKAYRVAKQSSANGWRGDLVLNLDRHMVRKMAEAIETMQDADRVRLAQELARLDYEVEPLRKVAKKETT